MKSAPMAPRRGMLKSAAIKGLREGWTGRALAVFRAFSRGGVQPIIGGMNPRAAIAAVVPGIARRFGLLAGAVVAAGIVASAPYEITAVDGDTVDRIWRHRLVGYDAPEIRRPKCAAEREAGLAARVRLTELIAGGRDVRLSRVQWRPDKYGRILGRLTIDGRDVAAIAIAEGWGRPYDGRTKAEGWCP